MANLTKNEAKEKIEVIVKKMQLEIEITKSTKPFVDYLNFVSKQYQYSFYNTMLIWSKVKDDLVMSASKWKAMERTIKDFSKKIWILAPVMAQITAKGSDGKPIIENGKEKKNTILTGFKWVYIFSLSNTEGKPLPECPCFIKRNMSADMPEYQRLVMACGLPVIESNIGDGCYGYTNGKSITIEKELSEPEKFMVLVHELGHVLNHYGENRGTLEKEQKELEAESIAYVIGRRMGIETQVNIDYMALYHKGYDIMASIGAIVKTVKTIEEMVNGKAENEGNEGSEVREICEGITAVTA